jgi:predicted dehydrogenase
LAELLQRKAVGQLLAVDADENLSQSITSGFYRAWRRDDHISGGFMVEKCSHDFDIFHFLIHSRVERVFSIAKRTHFIPRPSEEQHRRFSPDYIRNLALDYSDVHTKQIFENTSDECIYDAKSDVPDHQAVMLEFADGTLVNFMACLGQPRNTRRIRIFGANGSLEGDIDRGVILHDVPYEDRLGARTQEHEISFDESGHHGADSIINDAFWQAAAGGEVKSLAGVMEGIDAVLVGLAVEQSKRTGLPVDLQPFRDAVFGQTLTPEMAGSL